MGAIYLNIIFSKTSYSLIVLMCHYETTHSLANLEKL